MVHISGFSFIKGGALEDRYYISINKELIIRQYFLINQGRKIKKTN
jgi:hypothetical protein